MNYLPAVEIEPSSEAKACVIWLHGLGADGHDFVPIIPELGIDESHAVRFVFPHAPTMPVTINNGYEMPAWYDILEMSIDRSVDVSQLEESAANIANLIDREIKKGISSKKILLAGFSQGGAVAYQCGLTYPKPLAGILALSTYFATEESIVLHAANRNIPIHIYHGTQDPIVPEILGSKAKQKLQESGYDVSYKTYEMEHSIHPDQIRDLGVVINQLLK